MGTRGPAMDTVSRKAQVPAAFTGHPKAAATGRDTGQDTGQVTAPVQATIAPPTGRPRAITMGMADTIIQDITTLNRIARNRTGHNTTTGPHPATFSRPSSTSRDFPWDLQRVKEGKRTLA